MKDFSVSPLWSCRLKSIALAHNIAPEMYDPLNHKVVRAHKFKQYIVQPHNAISVLKHLH